MKINHPVTDREVFMKEGTILVTRTDLKGRITYTNDAFVEISGFSREELVGSNHNIVRHPDMPVEAFADLWNSLQAGKPWRGLVKNRCKNGDYYWVDANVAPVSEKGQVTGYLSARYAPNREQTSMAESHYALIRNNKAQMRPSGWLNKLNFVQRLGVGAKIGWLAILLILPSAVLIEMLVDEKNVNIEFAQQEIKGLEYVTPLKQVLTHIAEHRSLTDNRLQSITLTNNPSIEQTLKTINEDIKSVDAADSAYGVAFKSTGKWQKIKQDWQQLEQQSSQLSADANITQHNRVIEQISELLVDVSDKSNLTLDPEADTFYLMMLVSVRLPELIDYLHEFRTINIQNAEKGGQLSEKAKIQIAILDQRIRNRYKKIKHDIGAIYEANTLSKSVLLDQDSQFSNEVMELLGRVQHDIFTSSSIAVSSKEIAAQGTSTLDSANSLYVAANSLLKSRLESRIEALEQTKRLQISAVLAAILFVSLLGFFIVRHIVKTLHEVKRIFTQIGEGEFRNTINLDEHDELGELLRSLQTMQVNLNFNISDSLEQVIRSTRLERALDNVNSCVMLVNNQLEVIYMNKAVQALFRNAETDIRKELPKFDANKILGANIDYFHKQPDHQRLLLSKLDSSLQSEIQIGGRHLTITANPVKDTSGERIGTVVEWLDRTGEVKIEQEIADIVEAVKAGELSSRLELSDKQGFFKKLSIGINELSNVIEQVFQDIGSTMQSMSDGDLNNKINSDYHGVYLNCKNDINATIDTLRDIFSQVNESANFINNSSQEIASGNNNLSQRAEQQAANLQETAASMEELTSTVKNNASNAQQANQVALNARQLAEQGGNIVNSAVSAMQEINDSSTKIAEIIGVIDEIAFQTNLLALNASVEAARAGENGRGFSVVATEVRNLAQRSAKAAKESKDLIQTSVHKVRSGTALVNQTGLSLTEIVTGVRKVGDIVAEIAAASVEQSTGIAQVNQAVSQMDEITQQNAALAEQASAASVSMSDLAIKMVELLSFFKFDNNPAKQADRESKTSSSPRTVKSKTQSGPAAKAVEPNQEWQDF